MDRATALPILEEASDRGPNGIRRMSTGFAFDPMAGEEATTLGRLTVLQAHMNPDLAMGDELLKKTGSGNLLMVFGEPDIEVKPVGEGRLTIEIRGLDVHDPTTGAVRSVRSLGRQSTPWSAGRSPRPRPARSRSTASTTMVMTQ